MMLQSPAINGGRQFVRRLSRVSLLACVLVPWSAWLTIGSHPGSRCRSRCYIRPSPARPKNSCGCKRPFKEADRNTAWWRKSSSARQEPRPTVNFSASRRATQSMVPVRGVPTGAQNDRRHASSVPAVPQGLFGRTVRRRDLRPPTRRQFAAHDRRRLGVRRHRRGEVCSSCRGGAARLRRAIQQVSLPYRLAFILSGRSGGISSSKR